MWERELLHNLWRLVERVVLGVGGDEWRWRPGAEGVFTVSSCYKLLERLWLFEGEGISGEEVVFHHI